MQLLRGDVQGRDPAHAGVMFVGDGQQSIYPGGFTLRAVGLDVRGRSFLLRTNWRNTQAIADAAEAAMGDLPFGDLEDDAGPRPAREQFVTVRFPVHE
jgi:hypothetical protein